MKTKSLIATLMLLSISGGILAQESKGVLVEEAKYEFKHHWFLQGGAGVGYTIGEAQQSWDLFSPAAALNVGYQFTPLWAVRLGASGWEGRGGFPTTVFHNYDFNYVQANLDVMLSLSNWFGSYNPVRPCNWYIFAGGAFNHAFANTEAPYFAKKEKMEYLWEGSLNSFAGRAGVGLDVRLTDCIGLNFEVNATVLTDRFNSKRADNPDFQFNALAGLTIRLGKAYTKTEPVYAVPVVKEEEKPEPVVKEEPKPVAKVEPAIKFEPMTQNIFFDLNKSVVRDDQSVKIATLADYLKQFPEAKVTITGYADKNTGNTGINAKLGEQRAAAVAEAIKARGIAEDRIITDSKGDTEQPFQVNEDNRVSVCVVK